MVQEDKDLLSQLSAIMEENQEMKRRLEALEAVENNESKQSTNYARQSNRWRCIYRSDRGRIETTFKLRKSGKGVFLEVPWTQKENPFFKSLQIVKPAKKKNERKQTLKRGYVSSVLLKARFLDSVQNIWKQKHPLLGRNLSPNILPKVASLAILPHAELTSKTYVMCKLSLRSGKGGYLRLYFSKVWSEMILYCVQKERFFIGQGFEAPEMWEMKNADALKKIIAFPCKAKYRWEKNDDLLINIPSWLQLIGAGQDRKNFNLWINHSFSLDGEITVGHLFKKRSASHFRVSRKFEFYSSMKEARDSGTINSQSGIVEFIVALSPNPIFSE